MLDALAESLANEEYYAPLATMADPGPRFSPSRSAPGWLRVEQSIWTVWSEPRSQHPEQGWKIHVSARLDRAQQVLDRVAEVCFAQGVPFKHVSARTFFLVLHHKHAHRAQSGKFCAIYPPDTATARRLLGLLSEALRDEDGPYILSDRRFGDSRTVHYRYGAFGARSRLLPDGTRQGLVRDGSGRDVADERRPYFVLPAGITDPFVTEEPAPHSGAILIRDYQVVSALQPSNAGGTYQARDTRTGRRVFIKEARAHNGLTWDGASAQQRLRHEYDVLTAVHAAAPGVCPEPLEYFTEWEHDFLVTEFVEGDPLRTWLTRTSPLMRSGRAAADHPAFFELCRGVLSDLDRSLDQLHALGYRFGDINLGNVIVTPSGDARLVDFEAATALDGPPATMGTTGFAPPAALLRDSDDPLLTDRYGMAALALAFLAPLHEVAERSPAALTLLRHDLSTAAAPPPDDLWTRATAFHRADGTPSPAEVDADPLGCLGRFAGQVAEGLLATADAGRPDWVFPPPPEAFATNTVCVAYGTAGVVHALHRAGVPVPDEIEKRLRHDALARREELPPGLNTGTAGIARVLAALGHPDEAVDLAGHADGHPLTASCTTLAGGRAGVGLTWLALHRLTRDSRHLERAAAAGDAILGTADLVPTLGADDARGLFHGRSGLALFLHHLGAETGDDRYRAAGVRLLHQELDRAIAMDDGTLSFADNAVIRRAMPYLAIGAAGVGTALTRYAATGEDERIAAALPLVAAGTSVTTWTKEAGLFGGLAGLTWFLADHADHAGLADHAEPGGGSPAREAAVRSAIGLLKYAVPHTRGVRFLGSHAHRFSADLCSGAAGVLVALGRVLHGPGDEMFTLDPAAGTPVCGRTTTEKEKHP
ncbi:protein kinase-like protein [Streptomyces sp. 846.5]|nr:class III lanthionine synthetase LanKC [Streptomyces sp. 846.5]TDU03333.1 protein kinase-like protein [Streptomyces sp. 846.5]